MRKERLTWVGVEWYKLLKLMLKTMRDVIFVVRVSSKQSRFLIYEEHL